MLTGKKPEDPKKEKQEAKEKEKKRKVEKAKGRKVTKERKEIKGITAKAKERRAKEQKVILIRGAKVNGNGHIKEEKETVGDHRGNHGDHHSHHMMEVLKQGKKEAASPEVQATIGFRSKKAVRRRK